MTKAVFGLLVFSVLLSSVAQIMLKAGMSQPAVVGALRGEFGWPVVVAIATNAGVLGGLAVYFGSALVWLLVLSRLDVSLAYPFVGLGFIVTMLLAWLVRGEPVSLTRVVGTLLIALGVLIVARS